MDRKANQEKALAAYRERQQRVAALLARIQDKLARHAGPVVCCGHVG
jgi:two-component sensor histidine kinase